MTLKPGASASVLLLLCIVGTFARPLSHRYVTVEIGDNECDVDDYNAKGDGKTDDTAVTCDQCSTALSEHRKGENGLTFTSCSQAIQAAINHCGSKGGGRVTLGKDSSEGKTYLVFSLALNSSNTEFHISRGSTLLASDDIAAWKSNPRTS